MTQTELKEILEYNEISGLFIWLVTTGGTRIGDITGWPHSFHDPYRYTIIKIKQKKYLAHRLAWLYAHGEFPLDQIDHIDGDGFNNRLINLRCVDAAENGKNRKLGKNSSTGVVGVCYCNKSNKWLAQIGVNKKRHNLGYFYLFDDAVVARKVAEKEYGFHENHGSIR